MGIACIPTALNKVGVWCQNISALLTQFKDTWICDQGLYIRFAQRGLFASSNKIICTIIALRLMSDSHKSKNYKSYAVMPFNSEKILKSNTHYLKIFLQIWQVSFGFNSNSLSTVHIIIASKKELRQLWNIRNPHFILVQMCFNKLIHFKHFILISGLLLQEGPNLKTP